MYKMMEQLIEQGNIILLAIGAGIVVIVNGVIKGIKVYANTYIQAKTEKLKKKPINIRTHVYFTNVSKYKTITLRRINIKDQLKKSLIVDYELARITSFNNGIIQVLELICDGTFDNKTLNETYKIIIETSLKTTAKDFLPEDYPQEIYNKFENIFHSEYQQQFIFFENIWFDDIYDSYEERYFAVLSMLNAFLQNKLENILKVIINLNGDFDNIEYKGFKKGDYE